MQTHSNMQYSNRSGTAVAAPMMNGGSTYVVVADRKLAKIFEKDGREFRLIEKLDCRELVDNGMNNETLGRAGSYGAGRHKYEPSMEESRQSEIGFAKEVADWLNDGAVKKKYSRLVLVAAHEMLGELRKNLSKNVSQLVIETAAKELTNHNPNDLTPELLKIIPGPDKE